MAAQYYEQNNHFEGRRKYVHAAMNCLFAYERDIPLHLITGLQQLPGVRIKGITAADSMDRRVPTVSFTVDGFASDTIAETLAAQNIFVWSGNYYAVEVVKALGIYEEGTVRIGPVHYNSIAEIDQVLNALDTMLSRANVA
jgi:selenocysteine lyase/cysteine desulfurase